MTPEGGDRAFVARPFRSAFVGVAVYVGVWFACAMVLFGYEEQWVGPDDAFYTLASLSAVEQVAYVVVRYVLAFPAWPPQWVGGDPVFTPVVPAASGAIVGAVLGWGLDRRAVSRGD